MTQSKPLGPILAELDRCNKCGFCQSACPTYRVTGFEWLLTRGRVSLMQDVAAGTIFVTDPDVGEAVDSCLVCGGCISACPPQIQIHDIIYTARRERVRAQGLHPVQKLLFRHVLPRPGLMRLAVKAGHMAERLGLREWADRSGLLRRWPMLERANRVGPNLPSTTARRLIGRVERPTAPRARVAYFMACTKEFFYPESGEATVRVLEANQVEVVIPPSVCCGLPSQSAGDEAGANAMATKNVQYLQGLDVDAILIDEGACAAHMYDYPELLAGTPYAEAAAQVQAKMVDIATFLDRLGLSPPPSALNVKVTWHDPCSLRHYLKVVDAPRRLLQAVPGVEFVEARDAHLCCGGAGANLITQPELADELLKVKMAAFAETGADYIVTASPSCIMQLRRGAKDRAVAAKVLSLPEFLYMAYQSSRH